MSSIWGGGEGEVHPPGIPFANGSKPFGGYFYVERTLRGLLEPGPRSRRHRMELQEPSVPGPGVQLMFRISYFKVSRGAR